MEKTKTSGTPWWQLTLLIFAFAIIAFTLACSPKLHLLHNGDSLIHILAASEDWTPYYWGQDRLGMFYSLFGIPISSPLNKLITLCSIQIFIALLTFPALTQWLWNKKSAWKFGAVTALVFASCIPTHSLFLSVVEHPEYTGSILPGVLGLLIYDHSKKYRLCCLPLFLLATWVNLTIPIFLGILVLFRQRFTPTPLRNFLELGTLLVFSLLAILLPTKLFVSSQVQTSTGINDFHSIVTGNLMLWKHAAIFLPILLSAGIASIVTGFNCAKKMNRAPFLIIVFSALTFTFFFSLLKHVGDPYHGGYRACYQVTSTLLIFTPIGWVISHFLSKTNPKTRTIIALIPIVIIGLRHGPPSPQQVLSSLDQRYGNTCRSIIDQNATHIGGISWFIYDHLFHCQIILHQNNDSRKIYAFGFRDSAHKRHWKNKNIEEFLVALPSPYDLEEDHFLLNRPFKNHKLDPVPFSKLHSVTTHKLIPCSPSPKN